MKIQNLEKLPIQEVVSCLSAAFSNYFVPLPSEPQYWDNRYKAARVDWHLSFGMFDGPQLVGFIINGIDDHQGKRTAYNSGTGVLPAYRGKAIVDKLYDHAIPEFRKKDIEKCLLEVICENEPAKKVYDRIGFSVKRKLLSFKGRIADPSPGYRSQPISYKEIEEYGFYRPEWYSWDNTAEAVMVCENRNTFLITEKADEVAGYATVDTSGLVSQLEVAPGHSYSSLMRSLGASIGNLLFTNIPEQREDLIKDLFNLGFENTINQYEMEYMLQ